METIRGTVPCTDTGSRWHLGINHRDPSQLCLYCLQDLMHEGHQSVGPFSTALRMYILSQTTISLSTNRQYVWMFGWWKWANNRQIG